MSDEEGKAAPEGAAIAVTDEDRERGFILRCDADVLPAKKPGDEGAPSGESNVGADAGVIKAPPSEPEPEPDEGEEP